MHSNLNLHTETPSNNLIWQTTFLIKTQCRQGTKTVILDPVKRGQKKHFTDNKMEVLLNGVQHNNTVLFAAFSGRMSKKKTDLAWGQVTNAINAVLPVNRATAEVEKKRFDLKVSSKMNCSPQKRPWYHGRRKESYFSVTIG